MNIDILNKAASINKFDNSNAPIIVNITERYLYKPTIGTFDPLITVVIRTKEGHFRTYNMPTERALANTLDYLEKNPNFISKDLLQFIR